MKLIKIFYCIGLFSIGTFFVHKYVRTLYEKLPTLDDIPYKEKYNLDELSLNEREPKLQNLIIENTPDGFIIMRYNKEEEGFEYWANKSFEFNILKTVARKYCKQFNLKNLYIDGYKEFLKQKDKFEKFKEETTQKWKEKMKRKEEEEEEEEEESVFVKPKISEINQKTQEKEAKVDWKENKFIWKGKPEESPLSIKKKKKAKQLTFEDYKRIMKEKTLAPLI